MAKQPVITVLVATVLAALLDQPDGDHYGLELIKSTGLPSGTLYPILLRLEQADWLQSRWEDIDPVLEHRPARRYYRLTPDGAAQARTSLARLHERTGLIASPRWA